MRAVVISESGGPDVLKMAEVPDPVPAPGEVLVDLTATAVNRADLLQRQGFYPPPAGAPPYLGLECSGVISEVGEGVADWQVGDEVCALLSGGGYAERVAVPAGQLLPVPAGVSLVHAGGLPETTCTVHSMVFMMGRLQPGESFLVHGGSSGIGTTAIQIVKANGGRVFVTAGSAEKLAFCRDLGADVAINYKDEAFEDRIAAETDGRGVDVILDNMGASYLARNVKALAKDGRLIELGLQGGRKAELDLGLLMAKRISIAGATLRARDAADKAGIVAATRENVWPLVETGTVRPIIDTVFPLADAGKAHELVESSAHKGKVLLQVR